MGSFSKSLFVLCLLLDPLAGRAQTVSDINSDELKEQAIQEMVHSTSQFRTIVMGKWDPHRHRYIVRHSSRSELEQNISSLKPEQKDFLDSTRDLALVGVSAGSLLYLLPEKNLFFWEGDSKDPNNYWTRENLMTSPVAAGFLNQLLVHVRQDIEDSQQTVVSSLFVVLLNPADAVSEEVNRDFHERVFKEGLTEIVSQPPTPMYRIGPPGVVINNYIGLRFRLVF